MDEDKRNLTVHLDQPLTNEENFSRASVKNASIGNTEATRPLD